MKLIYLAAPIDSLALRDNQPGDASRLVATRYETRVHLRSRHWVFDPSDAWSASSDLADGRVQEINDAALEAADGMLAILPRSIPTVGVPLEIGRARAAGKPVVVLSESMPTALMNTGAVWEQHIERAVATLTRMVAEADGQPAPVRTLMVSKAHPDAQAPTRAYAGDAGWDLYVDEDAEIPPRSAVDLPLGVAVAIPDGYYGRIVGRSSTHRKHGLHVVEGIIDAGYRGPLFANAWNPSGETKLIERGQRIAQLILTRVPAEEYVLVDQLPESERGTRGFGSSGK